MSTSCCIYHRLGSVGFEAAWKLQERLSKEIAAGKRPPTLLLLEHPHTYTFGRRGQPENLLWDEAELERRGIAIYWIDRGGDVTYHGPGQLVGYPLLPLGIQGLVSRGEHGTYRLPQADYVGYLRRLEQALVMALDKLGIAAYALDGLTGVWVLEPGPPAKIAAIGVKVDAAGVTRHGFALNVSPDMSYWQGIIGCGLKEHGSTSLAELLPEPPAMEQVISVVARAFGKAFEYEMVESELNG
jgi:lipoyl(octanoyl) transferase